MMTRGDKHKLAVTILIGLVAFFSVSCLFAAMEDQVLQLQGLQPQANPASLRPHLEYTSEGLRDPFESYIKDKSSTAANPQRPNEPEKPLPSFSVQGIIWGGRIPQAIINNTVVKKGDIIEGVVINDINKNGVTVFFNNREYNLSSPGLPQNTNSALEGQSQNNMYTGSMM